MSKRMSRGPMSDSRLTRIKRNKGDGWDDAGGYMAAKIQKLENQFVDEKKDTSLAKLSNIFNKIAIHVNGYTKPSNDVLKKLMQQHGGTYHHYYSRAKVTHIIAINLPNSKVANLTDKKVVHPDWITESIKAEKLLPYQDFLLYKAGNKRQPSIKLTKQSNESNDESIQNLDDQSTKAYISDETLPLPNKTDSLVTEKDTSIDGTVSSTVQNIQEPATDKVISPPTTFTSPARSSRMAGDPNFVSEFYGHSRLHHISQWGAEMKRYVKTLQAKPADFTARDKLVQVVKEKQRNPEEDIIGDTQEFQESARKSKGDSQELTPSKCIMHIDMDSFFVSVGIRNKPELKGKPIAVTHSKGSNKTSKAAEEAGFHGSTAEIASCSYEARQKGVKNGMFLGGARELCPDIVCIPYDFQGYSEVSHQLYDLVSSYTHDIEAVSCDELFIDLAELLRDTGATALEFTTLLRREIKEITKCNASAGIGPNILLARVATTKAKPNGQYQVTADQAQGFMHDINVKTLPGVGRKMYRKLEEMGITTCSDLQQIPLGQLQKELGNKTGQMLHNYCRGKDERTIQTEKARKSVSAEINYGIRFTQDEEAHKFIGELSEEVHKRLHAISARGKTITLKLKIRSPDAPVESAKFMGHGICDSYAKSVTLVSYTDNADVIAKECIALLKSQRIVTSDIRGMGIQMSRLDTDTATSGVTTSILQFTKKITKPAVEENMVDAPQKEDSPFKIPEPKPRELPPLPSLDVSTQQLPLLQFEDMPGNEDKNEMDKVVKGATKLDDGPQSFWPSASQIDEDVLSELPPEIQAEIRQMTRENEQKKAKPTARALFGKDGADEEEEVHSSQEAGCSHWQPPPPAPEPSSPLKMAVLKQAPKNSKKDKSPRKFGTRGRGRPRKNQGVVKHKSPTKTIVAPKPDVPDNMDEEHSNQGDSELIPEREPVSLCGAVTLPEVKDMVQQWLQDSTEPDEEDVERFLEYLSALVQSHNLEQLLLLLRYLRRIAKRHTSQWEVTANEITQQAKVIVKSVYGSELKV